MPIAIAAPRSGISAPFGIQRINAAAREQGLTYGRLMHGLKSAGIEIDRKVLADIAVRDQSAFTSLTKQAQTALGS